MKTMIVAVSLIASFIGLLAIQADEPAQESRSPVIPPPTTVVEARARAKLLYETIRGSLQIMHRDFFEEDGSSAIPSASLEDVFDELYQSYDVEVKWLVINTDIVNIDHQPNGEFEKKAAKELAKGKPQYESAENNQYRYVGSIRLSSQCLKCHVRGRASTEDRFAGLLISMPLGKQDAKSNAPKPKAG